jgi:hypothetical protein
MKQRIYIYKWPIQTAERKMVKVKAGWGGAVRSEKRGHFLPAILLTVYEYGVCTIYEALGWICKNETCSSFRLRR